MTQSTHPPRDLLRANEAADLLGVTARTLRRWEEAGKVIAVRDPSSGRRAGYSREALLELGRKIGARAEDVAPVCVGRDAAVAAIDGHYRDVRIVTLWGLAGIGKTRLAEHYAAVNGPATVAHLQDSHGEADVAAITARALGLSPSRTARDAVATRLAQLGRHLLVLDNVEQIVEPVSALVALWTRRAPALRVLLTSRQPLGMTSEAVIEIGPLQRDDGLSLLCDRAGAEREDETARSVAELLEGIPLAIELAAARARETSLADVLGELRSQSPASAGWADSVLGKALTTAWRSASDDERKALAACSAFRGGFDEPVVSALLGWPRTRTLAALHGLRRRALIHAVQRRSSMFEVVRSFVRSVVDPATLESAEAKHAALFIAALPSGDGAWVQRERENLMAIHDRYAERENGARAILGLVRHLARADPAPTLIARLGRSLEGAPEGSPVAVELHAARAYVRALHGLQLEEAMLDAQRAVEGARALGDHALIGVAALSRGQVASAAQDQSAAPLLDEAIALLEDAPAALRCEARIWRGNVAIIPGDLATAERFYVRGLEIATAHELTREAMMLRGNIALLHTLAGNPGRAANAYEPLLAFHASEGDALSELSASLNLAIALLDLGRHDEAQAKLTRARELAEVTAHERFVHGIVVTQCFLALDRGDLEEAIAIAQRGLPNTAGLPLDEGCLELGHGLALFSRSLNLAAEHLDRATERLDRANHRLRWISAAWSLAARGEDPSETLRPPPLSDRERPMVELAAWVPKIQRREWLDLERCRDALDRARTHHSALTRIGIRTIERLLRDHDAPAPRLKIAADGSWFLWTDGRVSLARRRVLARVLSAIAHHREGRTLEELLEDGWPGAGLRRERAAHRIYGTVRALRSEGLTCLDFADGRYRIDPSLAIEIVPVPRSTRPPQILT